MVSAAPTTCQIALVFKYFARFALLGIWFLFTCIVGVTWLPFRWKDPNLGMTYARFLFWGASRILNIEVQLLNGEALLNNQPCIYVCNHQSNMDVFTICSLFPRRTVLIAKKEIRRIPFFGLFFEGCGNIVIDRADKQHAFAGFEKAARYVAEKKLSVWLFPEGTRNRGKVPLLPFKKGAFHLAIRAQIPILPVVHEPIRHYFNPKTWLVGGAVLKVRVLDPIPTAGLGLDDMPALMEKVHATMTKGVLDLGWQPAGTAGGPGPMA